MGYDSPEDRGITFGICTNVRIAVLKLQLLSPEIVAEASKCRSLVLLAIFVIKGIYVGTVKLKGLMRQSICATVLTILDSLANYIRVGLKPEAHIYTNACSFPDE
jgi:hypothetical protein